MSGQRSHEHYWIRQSRAHAHFSLINIKTISRHTQHILPPKRASCIVWQKMMSWLVDISSHNKN